MRKYEGNLRLNNSIDEMCYLIENDPVVDISKELDKLLKNLVHIKIINTYNNEVLFENRGILLKKNDLADSIWQFYVGNECLDDVLFDVSDNSFNKTRIEIKMINNKVKNENKLELKVKEG